MTLHRLVNLGVFLLFLLAGILPSAPAAGAPSAPAPAAAFPTNLPNPSASLISGEGGGSFTAISSDGRLVVYESAGTSAEGYWNVYVYDHQTGSREIASLGADGQPAQNPGEYTSPPVISADGRYVAFMSQAAGLTAQDTTGLPNIYLRDRAQGETRLVSLACDGGPADGPSWNPAISADGRYVAFQSHASNLVPDDHNDAVDVFVRDLQTGQTELVSVTDSGEQGTDLNDYGFSSLAISADGRYVAFSYQSLPVGAQPGEAQPGVFLRDRQTQTTRRIAAGAYPALTPDGRFLAFVSEHALVAKDTNQTADVYLYDLTAAAFDRISAAQGVAETNVQWILCAPALSADGRYVAFESSAALLPADNNGLSDIYLRDRQTGALTLISSPAGEAHFPALSADASASAFTVLTSQGNQVYLRAPAELAILPPGDKRLYLPLVLGSR